MAIMTEGLDWGRTFAEIQKDREQREAEAASKAAALDRMKECALVKMFRDAGLIPQEVHKLVIERSTLDPDRRYPNAPWRTFVKVDGDWSEIERNADGHWSVSLLGPTDSARLIDSPRFWLEELFRRDVEKWANCETGARAVQPTAPAPTLAEMACLGREGIAVRPERVEFHATPLQAGAIYKDRAANRDYVWNGDAWVLMPVTDQWGAGVMSHPAVVAEQKETTRRVRDLADMMVSPAKYLGRTEVMLNLQESSPAARANGPDWQWWADKLKLGASEPPPDPPTPTEQSVHRALAVMQAEQRPGVYGAAQYTTTKE